MWSSAFKTHQCLRTIRQWDNPPQNTNTENNNNNSITPFNPQDIVKQTQNNVSVVSESTAEKEVLEDTVVAQKRQRGEDMCDADSSVIPTLSSIDTNPSPLVKQRCEGNKEKEDSITGEIVVLSEKRLAEEVILIDDDDDDDNDNNNSSNMNNSNEDVMLQEEGVSQVQKDSPASRETESERLNSSQTPKGKSGLALASFLFFNPLSEEQQQIFDLVVNRGRSIFLTGGAGTGKSHLLRSIVAALPKETTFVTATTGIAALNLGGSTIHNFAGCGIIDPQQHSADDVYYTVQRKTRAKRNWRTCSVLVVDEISMMDAWFLDVLEYVARKIRGSREPFGGIQVVFSGDFLQLPPVVKNSKKEARFCFEAKSWCRINPRVCILSRCFRQKDGVFFGMLNEMRRGALTATSLALLTSLSITTTVRYVKEEGKEVKKEKEVKEEEEKEEENEKEEGTGEVKTEKRRCGGGEVATIVEGDIRAGRERYDGFTILRARRAEVEAMNMDRFNELTTKIVTYNGFHRGEGRFPTDLPQLVSLRVGCRVMLLKNLDVSLGLVNGSVGTLEKLIDTSNVRDFAHRTTPGDLRLLATHGFLPVVRFETYDSSGTNKTSGGRLVMIEPHRWTVLQGEREVSCSIQIPLQLAYAITIHKSQGMSLSHVNVDFKGIFEEGQAYVALSRCCDMSNLVIENFDACRVNPNVKALAYYKALDDAAAERKRKEAEDEEEEILKNGGSVYPWGVRDFHYIDNEYSGNNNNNNNNEEDDDDGDESSKNTPQEMYWKKSATAIIEDIRRRLTPTFVMLSTIRLRVLSATERATSLKGALFVMDTTSLFALASSMNSAEMYENLFLKQQNMIRVPRVVKDELLQTVSLAEVSEVRSTPTVRLSFSSARSNSPTTAMDYQSAAEMAAATLSVMEDAKNEFVLDEQREGESRPLPPILPQWEAFPLFSNTSSAHLSTVGNSGVSSLSHTFCDGLHTVGGHGLEVNENSVMRQVQLLEFCCYLMEKYGSHCGVFICTESMELAAHALSVGLRVCSLSYLCPSERA
ncbi:PIF1 helicase-like protein [Trypanosoma theileri]|uniref:ATP-dependent DNA helicase n=1 Tax=Trypanosoma theileri TaxID=67003 RepID=A0A1X0NPJ6_9TRYP|nr:PIF1 helicase-like protein [Trypanosoma theileri]ORC86625.1 PIF1 helicase-like protein [Trypanosoma theileri]